jgi:signal transduction histidine kinase
MRSRALLCLVVIAGLLLPSLVVAQPSQRSVLVLDQSSAFLPFNAAVANAIRTIVNADSRWRISFYSEFLDANRFFGPDYENNFVQFLKEKYRGRPINVVVVFGVSALDFMVRRRDEIWPSVPIVFAAIDEATIASLTVPKNVTGATMQLTLQDMVRVAQMVVPDLKAVAMVGDPLERQTFYRHFKDEMPAVAAQYKIINLMDLPLGELKTRLGSLPDTAAVIYTGIYYTSEGVSYVPAELTSQIAEWANRPVVINVSSYLNKGAVGGYIVQANPIGQQAGRLALGILGGENASDLPVVKVPSQLIFEWPALQRWKISEAILPPGSEILFRNPTAWDQYKWQIMLAAAIILAQTALIVGLLYEHRRRRTAEAESLRRVNELAHMHRIATVSELSASIAHELKQPLATIAAYGSAGLRWLARQVPDVDEVRINLQGTIDAANRASAVIDELRAMFRKDNSRQTLVDVNRLLLDTLSLTNQEIQAKNISVQTELFERSTLLVLADRIRLQQVILNLIANAIEAMSVMPDARKLRITSGLHDADRVLITVEDSGPGIAPENLDKVFDTFFTTKPSGMGMGLSICRSIIEAKGGRLWASGVAPHGCIFHVVLPKSTP